MKTLYYLPALMLLALAAGCSKEVEDKQEAAGAAKVCQTFTATIEAPELDPSTKAFDADIKAFRFVVGSEIAVSDGTTTSVFAATAVSETETTFSLKDGQPALANDASYKAYYPVSIAPGLSGVDGEAGAYMMQQQKAENGELNIPDGSSPDEAHQVNFTKSVYVANPMYAESSTKVLNFTNLCGLICITLSQPAESNLAVSQVIMQSSSPLFGPYEISTGAMRMTSESGTMNRIASINACSKFISANSNYYIAVPAGSYDEAEFIVQTNKRLKQHYVLKNGSTLNIQRNRIYTISLVVDDVRNDLTDGDPIVGNAALGYYGAANCFLINSAADCKKYVFKPMRADGTLVTGIDNVKVLWRAQLTSTMSASQVVVDDGLEYKNGLIYFTTSSNRGNALIGAYDADGNILWSWHIWMPNSTQPTLDTYSNGSKVLNRNLGALESTFKEGSNTNLCSGLYYQWGRKDPFPNRQKNTTAVSPWSGVYASVTISNDKATIAESIKNPGTYYATGGKWTDDTAATWSGENKSVYDPCPAGYRVWTNTCWGSDMSNLSYNTSNTTAISGVTYSTATNAGYTIALPNDATAYYAVNGNVKPDTGKLSGPCTMFRAWSRTTTEDGRLFYDIEQNSDLTVKTVKLGATPTTAYGMGVRCEKIQ